MSILTSGAGAAGLGAALSRQAERMDLDRRSAEAFERQKELTKYQLEQEELQKRSAWEAGKGSAYMANEADIDAARRKTEAETKIKMEAEKNMGNWEWHIELNPDGSIDYDKSGPKVNEQRWQAYQTEKEYSLNRPNPKTGRSQQKSPGDFPGDNRNPGPTTPKKKTGGKTSSGNLSPAEAEKAKAIGKTPEDYTAFQNGTETPEQIDRRTKNGQVGRVLDPSIPVGSNSVQVTPAPGATEVYRSPTPQKPITIE